MELNNQYGNYSNPEGQNQISTENKQSDPRYKFYMKYAQGFHLDGTPFEEQAPQAIKKNSQAQNMILNRYNSADHLVTVNQQPKVTTNQKTQINNIQKYSNDNYREQLFHNYSKTNQTNTVVEKQVTTTRTVPQVNYYNQTVDRSVSPQINRPISMNYQQSNQNINYTNSQFINQNSLQRVRSNPDLLSSGPLSSGYKIEQKKLVSYDKKKQENKDNYKYNLFSVLDQPWNGCLGSDTGKCAGNECFASDGQRGEGWK